MNMKVSQQKALGIVRRELGEDWKYWWDQMVHHCESLLLKSGAKLSYRKAHGFQIGGYHYAGDDVTCYL